MGKVFCLETEWVQSVHDMKRESQVKSLLEFLKVSTPINNPNLQFGYCFRQVATKSDFMYYMDHLTQATYDAYNTVYIACHGETGEIDFANSESMSLDELAVEYEGVLRGRNVHFGCCKTLRNEDEALVFKRKTGARMVTGYAVSVPMTDSFIFELWLMNAINTNPGYAAARLRKLAEKEMAHYVDVLEFRVY